MEKENNKKKKVKKQRYFIDDWLSEDSFKDWLRKDKSDNTKGRCAICQKSIELSSSGRSALTDHAKGAKHNEELRKVKSFFQKVKKTSQEQPVSTSSTEPEISTNQKTLESCVIKSEVTKAEIIWLLKTVDSGFSIRSNDDLSSMFMTMFPDSAIASQFQMARSKSMYELNHGLAPHFKSILVDTLKSSDIHVIFIR